MDARLARAEDVMSSQRAHHARQTRKEKVEHIPKEIDNPAPTKGLKTFP